MLHLKQLTAITEADLHALIIQGVREGQQIDYKADINLSVQKAKPELLRDLSSFANASGGDYVLGMTEKDGLPTGVDGLAGRDIEGLEQQILQTCRAHLDPPITGMRFHAVKLSSGNDVLILRIPKTWNSPHMVMMDNENRCWTRDNSGKRVMDVPDLKQALAFSEGAAERMKRFRMERVGNAMASELALPVHSNQCLMMHLFPLISFTTPVQVDVVKVEDVDLPVLEQGMGWNSTFNVDGKVTFLTLGNNPAHAYSLIFRNGVIEAVHTSALEPRTNQQGKTQMLFYPSQFKFVWQFLQAALRLYRKLAIPAPIFGAVSCTGVKGYSMYQDWNYSCFGGRPLHQDLLLLPEFMIEDLSVDPMALLQPVFDIWWQACGFREMPAWVPKKW